MTAELNQLQLMTGLVGGLALFLFGMDIMTGALKQVAGESMKALLERVTGNRWLGLTAGASVTAIIQSSSITTVLLVGFISAGLMTTQQSVAVILGANIGTTITAQILAFKVTALALPVLSLGFFVSFLASQKVTREYGRIFLGLGMVFFGMSVMSEAMYPLRSYQPFLDFMLSLDHVLVAALVGAIFTALVQSSSATTGILIVMAGQGLIGLEPAIALALGANIGTCITALLASLGKPRDAVRAALVHTLFNVVGVLIWIGLIDELARFTGALSTGGGGVPRQLANAHTIFNVVNALLFIGFTNQITRAVEWLVPPPKVPTEPRFAARHLDQKFLDVPAIAIDAVRLEILRLAGLVREMLAAAGPALTGTDPDSLNRLRVMDRPVDLLHRAIVGYIRQVSLRRLPAEQSDKLIGLIKIANDLEHVGDMVATGMVTSARKRLEEEVVISPATAAVILGLHHEVIEGFDGVVAALEDEDAETASRVRQMKAGFAAVVEDVAVHEIERLRTDEPRRLHTYAREIELIESLDDVFKIVRRIALTELSLFSKNDRDRPTKSEPNG